jgi:hypothetical protein
MVDQNWFEEQELTPVQVDEFEELCAALYAQKAVVDEIKVREKQEASKLTKMKSKILAYLEEFGKSKYTSNHGTVYIQQKMSVKVPQNPEDKIKFLSWLEAKGIKDELVTVHSATLNSLYKEELAASENPDFKIPGIAEPMEYATLGIRSK